MRNPTPEQSVLWKRYVEKSGAFLAVLVFNLVIVLLLGSMVIWHMVLLPPEPMVFVKVKTMPPPKPPSSGGRSAKNPLDPSEIVTPPTVALPTIVISTAPSMFNVKASDAVMVNAMPSISLPNGAGLASGTTGGGAPGTSLFGSFSGNDNELQGRVYDLKINRDRKSTGMNQGRYTQTLHDFIAKGWDESVLSSYFKASKILYTPAIWIPTTPSQECARQMNLDNELTSTFWVGWYHAKLIPAQGGTYHFVGFGDDILAVAVNGQLVLDASLWPVSQHPYAMPWSYDGWSIMCPWRGQNYGKLRVGDDFTVNNLEPVTIDVLMGDEPGDFTERF